MGLIWSTTKSETESDLQANDRCYINELPKKTAFERHMIDTNNTALKKAKEFRAHYAKLYAPRNFLIGFLLRSNFIVKDALYALKKGYLDDIDKTKDFKCWESIEKCLKEASDEDDPVPVLTAYSRSQAFSSKINTDMAKNTYHEFSLYCTQLNCNVLAYTQDGIQAFISILFHPKLDQFLVTGDITVYRGSVIEDESVVTGYGKGAIIITTTLLATTTCLDVAKIYCERGAAFGNANQISILCTYHIYNRRRTALRINSISSFQHEDEILIYPYIPFRIVSYTEMNTYETLGKEIKMELEEVDDDEIDNFTDDQGLLLQQITTG